MTIAASIQHAKIDAQCLDDDIVNKLIHNLFRIMRKFKKQNSSQPTHADDRRLLIATIENINRLLNYNPYSITDQKIAEENKYYKTILNLVERTPELKKVLTTMKDTMRGYIILSPSKVENISLVEQRKLYRVDRRKCITPKRYKPTF